MFRQILQRYWKQLTRRKRSRYRRDAFHAELSRHSQIESLEDRRVLSTFNVTTTIDESDGGGGGNGWSLRDAILAANSTSGADTINVPAGTYNLTLSGTDDTAAAGDLDILDDTTIVGAGVGVTIINAGGTSGINDRVFDVQGGSLDITGVTVQGGRADYGGGLRQTNTDVTIRSSRFTDNVATSNGGAIYAFRESLRVLDSEIDDNSALYGGGIALGDGYADIVGTTIFNNAAGRDGGDLQLHGERLHVFGD